MLENYILNNLHTFCVNLINKILVCKIITLITYING